LSSSPPAWRSWRTAGLPVALALSGLLHLALIALPMLGERSAQGKAVARGALSANTTLTATLATGWREKPPRLHAPAESGQETGKAKQAGAEEANAPQAEKGAEGIREGAGLLPIASGPVYFTTDQLTKRPQAIQVAELDTAETRSIIVSGVMILQLRINDRGEVVDVEVEESGLPAIFARTAADAFKHSRFTPGERDGVRVNTLMRIEVRYDDARLSGR